MVAALSVLAAACSDPSAFGPADEAAQEVAGPTILADPAGLSAPTTESLPTLPPLPAAPPPADPVTVLAVGNLGRCNADMIGVANAVAADTGLIFALGDLSTNGSQASIDECFLNTFGSDLDRIYAVPGDQDLVTDEGAAFYDMVAQTPTGSAPGDGWFVTSMGGWQIIGLNSRCHDVGCDTDSAQFQWLVDVLRNQPAECRAVIWHDARFSSAFKVIDAKAMGPILGRLSSAGTDVLITGSPRSYERLGPSKPNGQLTVDDERGITHFNVGGGSVVGFDWAPHVSSQDRIDANGYARFVFSPEGYTWEFVDTSDGNGEADGGAGTC